MTKTEIINLGNNKTKIIWKNKMGAVIREQYFLGNDLHRTDGPAHIQPSFGFGGKYSRKMWFLYGKNYTKKVINVNYLNKK